MPQIRNDRKRSGSPIDVDMFGDFQWSAADLADLAADFSVRPQGSVHMPQQPQQPAAATRASSQRPNNRFSAPFRGAAQQQFQPGSNDDLDFDGDNDAFQPPHTAPTAAPAGRSHAQKMEKQQQDWEGAHDLLCARAVRHTPLHAFRHALEQQHQQIALNEYLSASWQFNGCCTARQQHEQAGRHVLEVLPPSSAVYFSMQHRFFISIPQWRCVCCKQLIRPQPQDAGCWPSTVACPFR